jgi:L-arabinose isomerase
MTHDPRPKIGLFAGGMEQYWTECGMDELPAALERDVLRFKARLEATSEVVFPRLAVSETDAREVGRQFRDQDVDLVVMFHATYVDDVMTLALLEAVQGIYPVLFLSQGMSGIPEGLSLIEAATCWGVNSAVQLPGSLRRLWGDFRCGFVFGHVDDERSIREIGEYARAARAVRRLRRMKIGVLPHRSAGAPMFDTFPDEARMIGQTGIRIEYLYAEDLVGLMGKVPQEDTRRLTDELYALCDVIEPSRDEVELAARQALALERLVREEAVDALAIDMFPGLTRMSGMLPAVGMARLIDQGVVVASEGDLGVSVAGLLIREICGLPIHFWEHSMFDEGRNWILGGHEGGSAGFRMARDGFRPRLRCTQYINFGRTPGAPYHGVLPEFITRPGRVTLASLFRGEVGYEMRLARGQSVDTPPREVHYEHTIFQPDLPLREYFQRIAALGVCHHFALVHADLGAELERAAEILSMRVDWLTD